MTSAIYLYIGEIGAICLGAFRFEIDGKNVFMSDIAVNNSF